MVSLLVLWLAPDDAARLHVTAGLLSSLAPVAAMVPMLAQHIIAERRRREGGA